MSHASDPSCLLSEVGKLISDEAADSIDRMIALASGELVPAESVSPSPPLSVSPSPTPSLSPSSVRVYRRAPRLFPIEFIINYALGIPGAEIEYYETTADASEKLQGAKCRELKIDHSDLLSSCEKQIIDALPIAIERLFELAAGITVQRTHYRKPYTITCKPDVRAIEIIAERVAGKSTSVIGELRNRFENPDTDREYTREDIAAMSQAERIVLRDALLRKQQSNSKQDNQTSSPLAACGRGAGGEGFKPGGEGFNGGGESLTAGAGNTAPTEPVAATPAYILTANKRFSDFFPTAIRHMKSLAHGAQTIIETETERKVYTHEPDARANAFLISRFMGGPTNYLQIEKIVEKTAYELEIERVSALYPDIIAQYGSAQAVIAAYGAN
jgi:hypothetical protein